MSTELAAGSVEEIVGTLLNVLQLCNKNDDDSDTAEKQSNKFKSLMNLLVSELSNANIVVRESIQKALTHLAHMKQISVTQLLVPVRDRLVTPIFSKPLRALPFSMQIGNIDAITYCLMLEPPLLDFNDELVRLFQEALALADADDQALTSKASAHKNAASLTTLRMVCIRLLSVALSCAEFNDPVHIAFRFRIIQVFFKTLYSKSLEVVKVAKIGLQKVVGQQQKLPKELLQTGLRPILMNLSDYKRLTVEGLQGLGRLLELLTSYFKVEIGRKLLDHLQQWATPSILEASIGKLIGECAEMKVVAAILEVFHLLPSSGNMFLVDLIQHVMSLESSLRRSSSSPFRSPLLKFMNRYPTETVAYFISRVEDLNMARFFTGLLSMKEGETLRGECFSQLSQLEQSCFAETSSTKAQLSGIMILKELWMLEYDSSAAPSITPPLSILSSLLGLWKKFARRYQEDFDESMELYELHAWRSLAQLLLAYCWHREIPAMSVPMDDEMSSEDGTFGNDSMDVSVGQHHVDITNSTLLVPPLPNPSATTLARLAATIPDASRIQVLFELVTVLASTSIADFSFLKQFILDHVALCYSNELKLEIMRRFVLEMQGGKMDAPPSSAHHFSHALMRKICFLRYLVIPMLSVSLRDKNDSTCLSQEVLHEVHRCCWPAETPIDSNVFPMDAKFYGSDATTDSSISHHPIQRPSLTFSPDLLTVEILQLTTLLLQHCPERVAEFRKDVIKYAWSHLKHEDMIIKQSAYVVLVMFVDAYETPSKISIQIFVSLLRSYHSESKTLVRQALDILLPALQKHPLDLHNNHNSSTVSSSLASTVSSPSASTVSFPFTAASPSSSTHAFPTWVRWTRKVLVEDGHVLPQLISIWQLVIRHPALYFGAREQFVQLIVGSLGKLGLAASSTSDTRILSVELVELICLWEWKERKNLDARDVSYSAPGKSVSVFDLCRVDGEW